jgi:hypothetical protein
MCAIKYIYLLLSTSLVLVSCSGSKVDDQNKIEFNNVNDGTATFNDLRYDMIRHIATFMEPTDIVTWRYVNCLTLYSLPLKKLVEQLFNISGLESISDNEPELAGVMALAHTSHDPVLFFTTLMEDVVCGKKPYKVLFSPLILYLFQNLPVPDKRMYYQYYNCFVDVFMINACLEKGHFDLVLGIVRNNVDLSGMALESAAKLCQTNVVELLLQSRTDIPSYYAGRALCFAAEAGHTPIVQLLLLLQSRTDIPSRYVGLALSIAAENRHTSIVELLLQSQINISADHVGRALRNAVKNRHTPIVELLLERDIDISADHVGRAHRRAAEAGHTCFFCLIS